MLRSVYTLVLFSLLFFGHQRVCFAITKDDFYSFGAESALDSSDICDVSTVFALQKKILVKSCHPVDSVNGVNINVGGKVIIMEDTSETDPQITLNVLNVSVMVNDQKVLYHRTRAELDGTVSVTKLFAPFMESFSRNHTQFVPTSYSVFTWDLNITNSVNLFQVIIATDGTQVLIAYMYAEGMLQYTLPANHDISMGIEVCGETWAHPNSTKSTILNDLVSGSNINVPGVWMFMINNGELILPVPCSAGCSFVTGTCSEPNTCSCFRGWEGDDCTDPSCPDGCVNGICTAPFTCTCSDADHWTGADCSVAICDKGCVHGVCTHPDICVCNAGWEGDDCNTAICLMGCVHGTCVAPDDCVCDDGYTGQSCDTPICLGGEDCAGVCNVPGECLCFPRQTGVLCHECVEGYKGILCDTCSDGYTGDPCMEITVPPPDPPSTTPPSTSQPEPSTTSQPEPSTTSQTEPSTTSQTEPSTTSKTELTTTPPTAEAKSEGLSNAAIGGIVGGILGFIFLVMILILFIVIANFCYY